MKNKLIFGLIWLGFTIYAFAIAPDNDPNTVDLIINLSSGKFQDINPLIIALFNLMGILPIIYTCFLLFDGRSQKIPAWVFVTGSFGFGAFAILPYLALRQPSTVWSGEKNTLLKVLESPITGIFITIGVTSLLFWGIVNGNWSDFIQQWHTSKFIHVMSLDFCLLCLLLPVIVKDDLARRNINNSLVFWGITLIPLFGTLAYLCSRNLLEKTIMENHLLVSNEP
ncbi:MAG: DUF2834 domain-containing protein [Xenococcaceae cyanobacterium MO_188.B19]|nr:DUF2834 domain-containing protein [Xenococcaceae cyanobacterium MO_188.B19]